MLIVCESPNFRCIHLFKVTNLQANHTLYPYLSLIEQLTDKVMTAKHAIRCLS